MENTEQVIQTQRNVLTILVEEEERIRRFWTEHYHEMGWPLDVYENPFDFQKSVERYRKRSEKIYFYLDQDFGSLRGIGVQLARLVRGFSARQTVCLITAYPSNHFRKELDEGVLDCVFTKFPEPIFGKNYFDERLNREIDEKGVEVVLEQTISRMERAIALSEFETSKLVKTSQSINGSKSTPQALPAVVESLPVVPSYPWWKRAWLGLFSCPSSRLPDEFRQIEESVFRGIPETKHFVARRSLAGYPFSIL